MGARGLVLELKLPPPVVLLMTGTIMWLARPLVPRGAFELPWGAAIVTVFFVIAFVVASAGAVAFGRAQTTMDPRRPDKASRLVEGGIYRYTRNPMYLGMLLALVAWALLLRNWIAFTFLPVFVLYMNRFQIGPEERALSQKFGGTYTEYKSMVRRWL